MSLVNAVLSGGNQPEPKVGDAATVCYYSDRNPVEIAEIVRFKSGAKAGQIKGVKVRAMDWKIVRGGEHDGSAVYEYSRNPKNPVGRLFVIDKRGRFVEAGTNGTGAKLSIGSAERYYDPHF